MLNRLVRRISTSLFQRPDRPWNDDPTSTAPSLGSKRRFIDDDDGGDGGEEGTMLPPTSPVSPGFDSDNLLSLRVKRQRVVDVQVRGGDETKVEEEGVKEVTEGVREVDITSQSSDNKDVLEDDVERRRGDETSLDNGRLEEEKAEKAEKAEEKEEEEKEEEGEEGEASNVPLPDSPLLLPLPEQSLTPTSLVDPLATEPVECRGFEGGEAEADVDEGEELGVDGVDGGVGVVDVEDVVLKTVADAVAPGESASSIDVPQASTLTATTLPLGTTTTTTTTSVAPPSESSS